MDATTATEMMTVYVCQCCALLIANGDDTECRDYYDHEHAPCELDAAALTGASTEAATATRCDGCGQNCGAFAPMFEAEAPAG